MDLPMILILSSGPTLFLTLFIVSARAQRRERLAHPGRVVHPAHAGLPGYDRLASPDMDDGGGE